MSRKSKKFLSLLRDKRILSIADSLLEWRVIQIGDIFFFSKSKSNKDKIYEANVKKTKVPFLQIYSKLVIVILIKTGDQKKIFF